MKQNKIIEQIKLALPNEAGIDAAILYGSFGRNKPSPNSDIDIQLLCNVEFNSTSFIRILKQVFHGEIRDVIPVSKRNKIVIYFNDSPKLEFAICSKLAEIDKHYVGSEITEPRDTILFEKQPAVTQLHEYLSQLISDRANQTNLSQQNEIVDDLIAKFIYEYESCSTMHRRSDGYQYYFFYNIAVDVAVQLMYLSRGYYQFKFLPKYFIPEVLSAEEQQTFYNLSGSLFLPQANNKKRRLLDFFYSSIQKMVTSDRLDEVRQLCEWIFERDYYWNFRDVSKFNPRIKTGVIYRTATMTFFQNDSSFADFLKQNKITTVIDFRADKEVDEHPYNEESRKLFKYVRTPFDPWNQPEWFKKEYHHGTNEEIAYRFFGIGCQQEIKAAMESIIRTDDAVAVHCFAGKDRTGIFVSLLHLLADTPLDIVYTDYLASEVDVKLNRLEIVLEIVKDKGGICEYLMDCGLSKEQIDELKKKILV